MGSKIVVAGVATLAVHVAVERFPVRYASVRQPLWMDSGVGGTGAQVAAILQALGDEVELCTIVGRDAVGRLVREELRTSGLDGPGVIESSGSAQSLVLVAADGRRIVYPYLAAVNVAEYPADAFAEMLSGADLAVLTNTDFVRPLLAPAVLHGVPVAVDVNVIADINERYYQPWLEVADIIFCSDERLPCPAPQWISRVMARYPGVAIAGVGCGRDGSVLGLRNGRLVSIDAVAPMGVRNTSSAGDSLFAAFLHGWLATGNPVEALIDAVVLAGWRVGHRQPTTVLLTEPELAALRLRYPVRVSLGWWNQTD